MATNAGAISVSLSADTAQFESAMTRSAATAEASMQRTTRAQQAAQRSGDAFVQSIQQQVDSFGLTGTALMRYQAQLKGVGDRAEPLIQQLDRLQKSQAALQQSASVGNIGDKFGEAANGAEHASGATSGLTRELIVLGHEASTGNYTRLGGSLLVIAEYSSVAQRAISALLGPWGLVAAAILAVGAAALQAFEQQKKLTDSLLITGNYAGVTRDSFNGIAQAIAKIDNAPIGKVNDALQAVVSSGRFTGQAVQSVAAAAVNLARLTGQSSADVVKQFEGMTDGVVSSATKLNEQYHFLSAADLEYVKQLGSHGKTQDGVVLVMDKLNERLRTQADTLGPLAKGWQNYTNWVSSSWNTVGKLVSAPTLGDQLKDAQQKLADLRAQAAGPDVGGSRINFQAQADAQQTIVDALQARMTAEVAAAKTSSTVAVQSQQQILHASTQYQDALSAVTLAGVQKRVDADAAARETQQIALDRGYASNLMSIAQYEDKEYALQKGALSDRLALIGAQEKAAQAKQPTTEIEGLQQQKQLVDLAAQRYAILANIAKLDEARRTDDKSLQPKELIDRQPASPQQTFSQFERGQSNAADDALRARAESEQAFVDSLKQQGAAVDKEIAQLDAETAAMGMSTLARQQMVAIAKLQAKATEDLKAHPEASAAIEAQLAASIDKTTAAYKRSYDAQNSFSAGAAAAFRNYQEAAANNAKFAENVIGGGLDRLTDSLAKFAETGKLSFTDLFTFMAEEFLKQLIRMQIAQAAASAAGSGSWLGAIIGLAASYFTGGTSGATAGAGAGDYGLWAGASGTNMVPQDMYAKIHKGEAVVPAAFNPALHGGGGRAALTVNVHNNVGADVSTQSNDDGTVDLIINKAAAMGAQMGHAKVVSELASGGTAARAVQQRFGLTSNLARRN